LHSQRIGDKKFKYCSFFVEGAAVTDIGRFDGQRACEQKTGVLASDWKQGHGFVPVRLDDDTLLQLSTASRGVLQKGGEIHLCSNGDRYAPLKGGALVIINMVYDARGTNPAPGMWAPKK
jgi:hypothetical protein